MKGISLSPSNHCQLKFQNILAKQLNKPINTIPFHFTITNRQFPAHVIKCQCQRRDQNPVPKNPINTPPPLVVVGSANFDIYVEIDRLPKVGETVAAKTSQTLAGGKGANQAACGAKLSHPTYFVGQVGEDANGKLITDALSGCGVRLDYMNVVKDGGVPTGHAVVMLQSDGQNSIIIVGGANMSCWPEKFGDEDLEVVKKAGIVLLQREIPDSVNIQVAKAARSAGVPVIFDAGGMDAPIPQELLNFIDILRDRKSVV